MLVKQNSCFFLFLISACLSLRGTKVVFPSVCPSMATCSVFSTVIWLLIWNMPLREWMSLSTSWTRKRLHVKKLQELLTTSKQLHRITNLHFNHKNVSSWLIWSFISSYLKSGLLVWRSQLPNPGPRHALCPHLHQQSNLQPAVEQRPGLTLKESSPYLQESCFQLMWKAQVSVVHQL